MQNYNTKSRYITRFLEFSKYKLQLISRSYLADLY